jgi:hypothetical protein
MQRNSLNASEGACPRATNRPKTTRMGTPAGSEARPANTPDQPRPRGSRRGRGGLNRSAIVRGFAPAPDSARAITSRKDEVPNGSRPKYVPPGKCGRWIESVARVRFWKESATRQTASPTTRRRVRIGMGSARVPQFSCQPRFTVCGRATLPELFDPHPPAATARATIIGKACSRAMLAKLDRVLREA